MSLPPRTEETKLQAAFYNESTGKWEIVAGVVDTVNHTINIRCISLLRMCGHRSDIGNFV